MRAAVVSRYGPPEHLELVDVPAPEPRAGEVLVRVAAVAVTSGDARMRAGRFPRGFGLLARLAIGLRGPRRRILGIAIAGTVESVGSGVVDFSPGDPVAGMTGSRLGGYAELVAVSAATLVPIPAGVTPPDAAGVLFGGTTALYFLRDRARIKAGDSVLVNGASGAVGASAVQLAKHFGAEVTAVTSERNAALVRRLGADHVVDYAQTPVQALPSRYDIVFDAVGNLSRTDGRALLNPDGSLILAVASLADTVLAREPVIAGPAPERADDVAFLLQLAADGELDPLTEVVGGLAAVVEAHRRVDSGRKVGNLVVLPGA
ncbi:MAG TPA: NAD(P)-dependent alcohol dehydrogenase [Propionicimonas sp.]|jgi:NADPH:quinone reductase-like Zn-dependent oxidoreductase|nr:NAD(P)-dependent alcohol dehydrogenase [Propionicimonas sp.]